MVNTIETYNLTLCGNEKETAKATNKQQKPYPLYGFALLHRNRTWIIRLLNIFCLSNSAGWQHRGRHISSRKYCVYETVVSRYHKKLDNTHFLHIICKQYIPALFARIFVMIWLSRNNPIFIAKFIHSISSDALRMKSTMIGECLRLFHTFARSSPRVACENISIRVDLSSRLFCVCTV